MDLLMDLLISTKDWSKVPKNLGSYKYLIHINLLEMSSAECGLSSSSNEISCTVSDFSPFISVHTQWYQTAIMFPY